MENVIQLKDNIQRLCRNLGGDNFGDVMVVGGGISGIQASLDLGTAGFKVYLVDAAPTIGGHMAQLDKTFPTNDCSMCIESPKFVECNRHSNIEIMTYTEVDSIEGEAGNFKVTLIKKPRYIHAEKCTGCTSLRGVLPGQVPRSIQSGYIEEQSHTHILPPGHSPEALYRRKLSLPQREKMSSMRRGV